MRFFIALVLAVIKVKSFFNVSPIPCAAVAGSTPVFIATTKSLITLTTSTPRTISALWTLLGSSGANVSRIDKKLSSQAVCITPDCVWLSVTLPWENKK